MPIVNSQPDQQLWVALNNGGAGFVRIDRDGVDSGTNQDRINEFTAPIIRPNDIVFDTVHGLYFFADSVNGNRRIIQGNIADLLDPTATPTFKVLYSDTSAGTAGGQILGLTIDVDAATGEGHLYFVNQNGLKRVTYDHDGNSALNQTPNVLAQLPAGSFANEVALDIENNRAFILSTASVTAPVEVEEGTPGAIFDEDSGVWFIFATDVTNNEIWQVSGLDRTDTTTADTSIARLTFPGGANGGQDLPDSQGLLQSIDVDPTTGILYFTTQQINSGAFGETGGVYRYNLAAGTYETLYVEGNATDYSFEYIDVDPASGRYYVSNLSFDDVTGANTSSVLVHGLGAGTPTQFASLSYPAGAVPQGLIVLNAPTLAGADAGAVTAESAGAGSGASTAAVAIAAPDAHDGDTAGQVDQLAGAQVRIASGFGSAPGASESLTINGTASGVLEFGDQDISYSYNAATGVMTLSGASTFANYEAALALVSYSITGDNPDAYGTSTTRVLGYSVSDGLLRSDENQVTVTIAATNDAPVNTTGGPVSLLETDPPAAITGLAVSDVDADPANDAIEVTLAVTLGAINVTAGPGVTVSGNNSGQVVLTGTQNALNATFATPNAVTYSPGPSGVDTLTMTTNDLGNGGAGGAQQDTDVVLITVINVNDPPNAPATNSVSTAEDNASAATPIGATDPDGDSLTYSEKPGFGAANGTVTFDNPNGTFTYTPDPDFNGSDSFTILVNDGNGGTTEQVVSVTVTPVNDAPTASANNSVTTAEDNASAATPIGADDVDGDTLTYSTKPGFGPANGSVSYNQGSGTFTYTPAPNYNGSDSFTIVIDDGNGGTAEQVVSVTVTPVNDAPTAPATGSVTTDEDTASAAQSIGADDIDGDTLTYSEKPGFGAANGTVTFNQASGTYTYTPDPNFNGSDSFTILIDDGNGGTAEQTVSVNVNAVNDAPTGVAGNPSAPEDADNGSSAGSLVAQDPDSSSFTYTLLDNAGGRYAMDSNGNLTVADGLLLDYEQASSHTIRVRVTDDMGASSEFDVAVAVADVLGEDVTGDARDNTFWGGVEADTLRGMGGNDVLKGGGGRDILLGGIGNDILDGGAGGDTMTGGDGNDLFVLRKGEADGDIITDFFGRGNADGDSIILEGYGAGTTFSRVGGGNSNLYAINDNGQIEYVIIYATGQVHGSDFEIVTVYDYAFAQ